MKKESINISDRKYNIKYYSISDEKAKYPYILPSLKTLISKCKECYIVSKISGNKLHDKPYNVERVKISKTDDNTFVYNFIDIGSIKEDIKGIMTNYKDTILFFEIGVFADIYSYLRSHLQFDIINCFSNDGIIDISSIKDNIFDKLPIKKDKLIKRMQNYYDDNKNCILPAYKVHDSIFEEDKKPSNKVLYSMYHLPVLEKISELENMKLNLKDIADIFFSNDNKENINKSLVKKITLNKIKLIEESVKHLNYTELTKRIDNFKYLEEISLSKIIEHIFCLYYVLQHDSVLRDSYISSISIILDPEMEEHLSLSEYFSNDAIYFDKMFYHFVHRIKYLYLKMDIKFDCLFIGLEEYIEYQYNEVIKLCIDKYNEMKNELKDLFSELYSDDNSKMYRMHNLSHENYFDNENKFKSILNDGQHYVSLILFNYDFLKFLCSFIRFRIDYDIVEGGEEIVFSNLESKKYSNNKIYNIASIIDDINTSFYIAETLYFFNLYSIKSYKDILNSLHSCIVKLSCLNYELLKEYLNSNDIEFRNYIDEFNLMLKIAEEHKCIDDISVNSNKEVIDFLKTFEELKDVKRYEDIFINNSFFIYNQEIIYSEEDEEKLKKMEEKERKFQEEEKRERKIFFDANYKTIYKAIMYYIKVKESEDFKYDEKYLEEHFINALEYMYRVSYYKEYLIINNPNSNNNE
ncbi:hypothetical protein Bint_2734 [Brachyspira intermedia PWS/A]|uniref:Uncharacterized protein n=1 Tax=Brachyspira intermedia (strain ATCC 51140 / PWS/A) TaxID=1045858 RepID=G0EQ70_BRAIP|nr:hypothetical protein [Brachyspira intermedia]AEM23328.1 hypothetical protein Bint_2734 [Brachyspira intermedia PWS/A]